MRRVVRGFWGPREEPVEVLAGRWRATLERFAGLLPAAGSGSDGVWAWRQVHASGPATGLRTDERALTAALRAAGEAEGWSDRTGYALRLVTTGGPGWKIEVSGRAGGTPDFLLQSMVIGVGSPDGAEIPDTELLTALAESWEPDFGGVVDDDVLDALEDDAEFGPDEPAVGWVGYLSPGRAALLPDGVDGPDGPVTARREVRGGGVILEVAAPGAVEDVVRANVRLREAGVLRPLPRPMDRAVL
ncbi:hypothetical protein ACG5V6_21190 [Streptomyces chitinivorans]|uniref:Immunity protein 52 domain-containing protein n=1 Tax=Streptomyces chitinivorans TaxID=1257027 RepID=A0ABW7HXU2_9ACTN|nr:hypothetical protein [Streptomyces chitinivorans]MDH2409767.1 hypothetical protein [Streptomyces chitinivorans]